MTKVLLARAAGHGFFVKYLLLLSREREVKQLGGVVALSHVGGSLINALGRWQGFECFLIHGFEGVFVGCPCLLLRGVEIERIFKGGFPVFTHAARVWLTFGYGRWLCKGAGTGEGDECKQREFGEWTHVGTFVRIDE